MKLLDKAINALGGEAWAKVDEVVLTLDRFEEEGIINLQEHDALRHYFGIQELAKHYGGPTAWFIGVLNEGIDQFIPGEAGIQSQVDIKNNNIAIDHVKRGVAININDINSYDSLRSLLNTLEIPPSYEEYYER